MIENNKKGGSRKSPWIIVEQKQKKLLPVV